MISLRPYQSELIDKTRALMQAGNRSILIQSPTGSGKTLLTAHMVGTCVQKRMRAFFIVHRQELISQSSKAFTSLGIPHAIISPNHGQHFQSPVQIASIQTLARRHKRYPKPSLVIWDEVHHIASKSWTALHAQYENAYHIGLTATPERLDGQGLGKWFSQMLEGPKVSWLIEHGFLSPYRLYAPSHVNLSGIRQQMGDYARGELSAAMDKPKIIGSAVEHYLKYAKGKRAIVFAVSVEHSKHIVEQFIKGGINAAHVDGETATDAREAAIRGFTDGSIQVLSNVELFGEGFDVPAIDVVVLLRPTQSLGLYLQQVGRGLRPNEHKDRTLIFDHVGNCERFGLPDQEREWSLVGREKPNGSYEAPVRICPLCFGAQSPGKTICIFCGALLPVKSREVETVAGELQEVDTAQLALKLKWRREQGQAAGFRELVEMGKQRGYKQPQKWAAIIMKARQAKKLNQAPRDDFKWLNVVRDK